MPKWIQNGTEEQVVLDCDFDVDSSFEKNITIKWFFQNKSELIYEWIPRLDFRYVSGRLQGKFDWDFQLNRSHGQSQNQNSNLDDGEWSSRNKFRALAIKRPTTELSGRYICQVMSTSGDDSEEAAMLVYGE